VGFGVVLRGLVGMVLGLHGVAVRGMRMVSRRLVVAGLVLNRGLAMMLGRGFVVFSGLLVVFGALVFCHCRFPVPDWSRVH
jgi:hypothetical protein